MSAWGRQFEASAFKKRDVFLEAKKNRLGSLGVCDGNGLSALFAAPTEADFEMTGGRMLFEPSHGEGLARTR